MIRRERVRVFAVLMVALAVALLLVPIARAETEEYPYTVFNTEDYTVDDLNEDWTSIVLDFSGLVADVPSGQESYAVLNSTNYDDGTDLMELQFYYDGGELQYFFIIIVDDEPEYMDNDGLGALPSNVTLVLKEQLLSIYMEDVLYADEVDIGETPFSTIVLFGDYEESWDSGLVTLTYPEPEPTPAPSPPDTLNLDSHRQFWYEGDLIGFFQAIYVAAFLYADLFYGVVALLLLVPLYIKTKSLLLICILWVLLGSLFIVAFPLISGVAILFLVLGIGGLIFRLVRGTVA